MRRFITTGLGGLAALGAIAAAGAGAPPPADLRAEAFGLLKSRCVKCHGPAKREGGLNLAIPQGLVRGGKSGKALLKGQPERSPLWRRIAAGEMPPGEPLPASEKATMRRWIEAGAPGVPEKVAVRPDGDEHWAFQKLAPIALPAVKDASRVRTPIDRFIQARLEAQGLTLGPEADKATLIRRVAFDLTGLPPTPDELSAFLHDTGPQAYAAMVDRYLASPRYGERWGKYWLDAAGYADSNGYFNADTDRPLAYRYRDYVIRAINADKPWDRFIQEQLAGDELAGYKPGGDVTPQMVELLEATHFLRNSQDGTDSSDGNPDERRADKYAVLEGTEQIIGSSLLGLTVQCARCHDHKFEPFSQKDYYQLQAVLYPAFNVEKWVMPKQREMDAATAAQVAAWKAETQRIDAEVARKRGEFAEWARRNREPGRVLFEDGFDQPGERLATAWSNTAPGDTAPAGSPAVQLDSAAAPGAQIVGGALRIHESGGAGDRVLSTRQAFNWAPATKGAWIQASFDLLGGGDVAPYVGYFLALGDFAGTRPTSGGNLLLDGNAAGQATVYSNYPVRSAGRGKIGKSGYTPGHNYGARITNLGDGRFELAQIVDGLAEPGTVVLTAADLPSGGFGFEFCCARSFQVDNVLIETGDPASESDPRLRAAAEAYRKKRAAFTAELKALEAGRPEKPGRLAAVTDLSPEPPKVPLLLRGDYKSPKENVGAGAPVVLSDRGNPSDLTHRAPEAKYTTGRRLALARWFTQPGSRAEGMLARVTVNRWWQHHFGTGLVATPENLGYSGAAPSHPELLDYLAARFAGRVSSFRFQVSSSKRTQLETRNLKLETPVAPWSSKSLHREILLSAVYRQSSRPTALAQRLDNDGRLLSRYPLHRLDAEALRDGMLAVSGELDPALGGPYVPTTRDGEGDVVVPEGAAGAHRRSLYLQQKRTQVAGLLEVFDTPSIVFNCTARTSTTVPLQSLKLLNSAFVRARATALAQRLKREAGDDRASRLRRAWELVRSRPPSAREAATAEAFLAAQAAEYAGKPEAEELAWVDFCQMLLASNGFLYVE